MARADPPVDVVLEAAEQWSRELDDLAGLFAMTSLHRAAKLVSESLDDVLTRHGLTFTRFTALARLYWSDRGLHLQEIARFLNLHPTSITGTIDRLERDGLVRRAPHPSDRRSTIVTITAEGRDLFRALTPELAAGGWGFGTVGAPLLIELVEHLRRLRDALGDHVEGEPRYRALIGTDPDRRPRHGPGLASSPSPSNRLGG